MYSDTEYLNGHLDYGTTVFLAEQNLLTHSKKIVLTRKKEISLHTNESFLQPHAT